MSSVRGGLINCTGIEGVDDWRDFVPTRQTSGAVGYDVRACRYLGYLDSDPEKKDRVVIGDFPVTIGPKEFALFGVGVVMAVPPGVDCMVRPRSGLATKFHVMLANGPGTVDPDYRGEVACSMVNLSDKPYTVDRRDRIAQLIFTPILLPQFHLVEGADKLPKTTRADGGFGSTGMSGSGPGVAENEAAIRELDVYYMEIVLATARRSNCVRGCQLDGNGRAMRDERGQLIGQTRRLGCVIARGNTIVATGYNAQYPGAECCAEVGCLRTQLKIETGTNLEVCRAVHAEEVAIANAANEGASVRGCTLYCNAEPCRSCAKQIASLDLEALVILEGSYPNTDGLEVVTSAGIPVRPVKREWLFTQLDS